jgi:hypothetical protein
MQLSTSADDSAACLQHARALVQLVLAVYEAVDKLQQARQKQHRTSPASTAVPDQEDTCRAQVCQSQAVCEALQAFSVMRRRLEDYVDKHPGQSAGHSTSAPAAPCVVELLRSPELHRCFTLLICVAVASCCSHGSRSSASRGSDSGGKTTSSSSKHTRTKGRQQRRQ